MPNSARKISHRLLLVMAAVGITTISVLAPVTANAGSSPYLQSTARSCGTPTPGYVTCEAIRRDDVVQNSTPSGYGPSAIQGAYRLPSSTKGRGQVVAIVDVYDDPNAEADLAVYRRTFGLPPCTVANGCFSKVSQTGSTTLPRADPAWGQEISLDLDMVSATCPLCRILLVEAKDGQNQNVGMAVDTAARMGATAISNSYGSPEDAKTTDRQFGKYYNHPGIAITASSGDGSYGVMYPAASRYVTAVGGTSLTWNGKTRIETAWARAGSGCSAHNSALVAQKTANTGCSKRAVADVAAVADPYTGVAVYDSYDYLGYHGWQVYGGTSAAAPIIASVFALAGNAATIDNNYPYRHASSLNDITSGTNSSTGCTSAQLCTARIGWDGPTGLGTPNGIGAF